MEKSIKLKREDFEVLWAIEEGMNDTESSEVYTGFKLDKLKKIYNKLETLGLIIIERKIENYTGKDWWNARITEKAKGIYKKYKKWIPMGG